MTHLFKILSVNKPGPLCKDERETLHRFQQKINEDQFVVVGDIFTVNTGWRLVKLEIIPRTSLAVFADLVYVVDCFLRESNLKDKSSTPNFETLNKTGENEMNFKVTRKQVKQKYDETQNYFKKTLELMAQAACEEDLDKVGMQLNVASNLRNKLEVLRKYLSASEILMKEDEFEKFNS